MALNKNRGPQLSGEQAGDATVIPEVLRAIAGTSVTKQKVPNDVDPEAVTSTGDLIVESRVSTDSTDEKLRETVTLSDSGLLATDNRLTREFGGGVLDVEHNLGKDGSAMSIESGYRIFDSLKTKLGPSLYMTVVQRLQDDEWPILFGSQVDQETNATTLVSKQAVAAGTVGGVVTSAGPLTITSVTGGATTTTVVTATRHHLFPGDQVVPSGVVGTIAASINGNNYVVTPLTSTSFSVVLSATGLTGSGGSMVYNIPTARTIYYEVQPVDKWISIRIGSCVDTTSILGSASTTASYPISIQFETARRVLPAAYTGYPGAVSLDGLVVKVISGSGTDGDVAVYYNVKLGQRGEFPGWVQEYMFTETQLSGWSMPPTLRKAGGGEKAEGMIMASATTARAWSVRVPQDEVYVWPAVPSGETDLNLAPGLSNYRIISVQIQKQPLGLYRVKVISLKWPLPGD